MGNVNARTRVSGLTYTVEEDRSEERDFNNLDGAEGVENGPSRPESAQSGHCARSGSSDSREKSAAGPSTQTPSAWRPRWATARDIFSTSTREGGSPRKQSNPPIPPNEPS